MDRFIIQSNSANLSRDIERTVALRRQFNLKQEEVRPQPVHSYDTTPDKWQEGSQTAPATPLQIFAALAGILALAIFCVAVVTFAGIMS